MRGEKNRIVWRKAKAILITTNYWNPLKLESMWQNDMVTQNRWMASFFSFQMSKKKQQQTNNLITAYWFKRNWNINSCFLCVKWISISLALLIECNKPSAQRFDIASCLLIISEQKGNWDEISGQNWNSAQNLYDMNNIHWIWTNFIYFPFSNKQITYIFTPIEIE